MPAPVATLAPGLYAVLPLDGSGRSRTWLANFADACNRGAPRRFASHIPAGGCVLDTDAWHTGYSVPTPFGPLAASERYVVVPVASRETHFLPNMQDAENWIILDIDRPTQISARGSSITVGDVSFPVTGNEMGGDYSPPCPARTVDDVAFGVVDDQNRETACFTAADPVYGTFSFLFEEPRLDYDLQHIAIDDDGRARLREIGTPAARALLAAWDTRDGDHICLSLRLPPAA